VATADPISTCTQSGPPPPRSAPSPSESSASPWAPLRLRTFRILWLAQLGSNVGSWMQTVATQWLLVDRHATLVALVQTASLLPVVFLSLPAGVFADTLDRRKLLVWSTAAMTLFAAVLAGSTAVGYHGPALLLVITFLLGCGSALTAPAWQAIQPDLVPRSEIANAAALGSITVNGARAVGPALAGFLVAWVGAAPVFALNAISFVGILAALLTWQQPRRPGSLDSERMVEALRTGIRYLRAAPGVRRVIERSVLFALPASALWALLPIVSHDHYHLSASGYGLMLGALGAGAIVGVWRLGWLRSRVSPNLVLAGSALAFAFATVSAAVLPLAPTIAALVAGGAAWVATLSTLNAAMQISLPGWVRARGLAAYILAFMGAQAVGAFAWGLLATHLGLDATLVVSAVSLGVVALSVLVLPVHQRTLELDRATSIPWAMPSVVLDPSPTDGPVEVNVTYEVDPELVDEFLGTMAEVEKSRRRTGGQRWRIQRDAEERTRFRESFIVPSWGEHLRQHRDRITGTDADILASARALARRVPEVRHFFPATTAVLPDLTDAEGDRRDVGDEA